MEHTLWDQCGHKNAVGSRFCSGCGSALAQEREVVVRDKIIESPVAPPISS